MDIMKKIILAYCFLFVQYVSFGQDPHFSQFFASPLTLNPAFTGKFDGKVRVMGNYRNQWPTINNAFITSTAAVDFHVNENKIASNDTWGLGFMMFNDKSAAGAVNFNYATLSTAYHKGLDEDGIHQLGVGFQLTQASMIINPSELKFEDQLTANGFTGNTNERFDNTTLSAKYWDVSAGLLYSGSSNEYNNFYAGVSLYHLNKPRLGTTGYALNTRTSLHAGGSFDFNNTTTLHMSGLYSTQAGASETVLGGTVQLIATPDNPKPTSVYVGTWYRINDAFIPYVGLEYTDFRVGITYDVNSSSLKTASQRQGGLEVSLIYAFRPSTNKPVRCPKF